MDQEQHEQQAQQIAAMQRQIAALQKQIEEQDVFLSKAVHNLKNLLTRLIGYNQYVLKNYADVLDDLARDFLHEADDSSFLINDLLSAISVIVQVRTTKLNIAVLDMEQVIQVSYNRLRPLIATSEARIEDPDEWPTVVGDAHFVEKVWYNFLHNALKYSPKPVYVTIKAVAEDQSNMARFFVQDRGPGLSEAHKALMFTPFPRIHQGDQNVGGLGLYTARKIIEQLGGNVGIESELGQGATFSFTLPTAAAYR